MDVDDETPTQMDKANGGAGGELKIKGQAEAEKRRSKWEDDKVRSVHILDAYLHRRSSSPYIRP